MTAPRAIVLFFAGTAVSLGSSWIVVSRIERIGRRLGASEALLGLVSALAANAPEITSSVSALLERRGAIGTGVVIGSNVFNLAALLGLGSIIGKVIGLHRRVVVFQGAIALWMAGVCLATVAGLVDASIGFLLALSVLGPYATIVAIDRTRWWRRPRPSALGRWLARAIAEEELELSAIIHPPRGRARDGLTGAAALVIVVAASVAMERGASELGTRLAVPGIIVGGLVLAAVTSLPNAVAAVYWARRGKAVALLSTALNSNALNVLAGFLLPVMLIAHAGRSSGAILVTAWYAGLTAVVLGVTYLHRGLRRAAGWGIVAAYFVFVAVVVVRA